MQATWTGVFLHLTYRMTEAQLESGPSNMSGWGWIQSSCPIDLLRHRHHEKPSTRTTSAQTEPVELGLWKSPAG